jgi:hypothetical protein
MNCSKCHIENSTGLKSCAYCGEPLVIKALPVNTSTAVTPKRIEPKQEPVIRHIDSIKVTKDDDLEICLMCKGNGKLMANVWDRGALYYYCPVCKGRGKVEKRYNMSMPRKENYTYRLV